MKKSALLGMVAAMGLISPALAHMRKVAYAPIRENPPTASKVLLEATAKKEAAEAKRARKAAQRVKQANTQKEKQS